MSVQELIDKLEKVPDKTVEVFIWADGYAEIERIGIDNNMRGVSNKVVIFEKD